MEHIVFKDPQLLEEIRKYARTRTVPRDGVLIVPGEQISFVPIVQKGILRIVREDEESREIFLYHLYPGQTCAMAINCCQAHKKAW